MMNLHDLTPEQAVRLYLEASRKHGSPPSTMEHDPEMPRPDPQPPSGRYESLLLLVKGCSELGLEVMRIQSYGVASWHPEDQRPRHYSSTAEAFASRQGRDGDLTVANGPSLVAVSEALGITLGEAQRARAAVLEVVGERLAQWKAGSRKEEEWEQRKRQSLYAMWSRKPLVRR